jgi:hypothetical protein
MTRNHLTISTMDHAREMLGDEPVVMLNLLWFRAEPTYPGAFEDRKLSARSAYYEGYAGTFRTIAAGLNIPAELIYAGSRHHGLLAGEEDNWDDLVLVRYRSFDDLTRIVAHEDYERCAMPHKDAAIRKWCFIATKHL